MTASACLISIPQCGHPESQNNYKPSQLVRPKSIGIKCEVGGMGRLEGGAVKSEASGDRVLTFNSSEGDYGCLRSNQRYICNSSSEVRQRDPYHYIPQICTNQDLNVTKVVRLMSS